MCTRRIMASALALTFVLAGLAITGGPFAAAQEATAMTVEENKALVHRWVELWNTGNVDAVGEFVTPDYVRHDPNGPTVHGPKAEQQLVAMYLAAFPDLRFTIEHLVGEGDTVAGRYTARGTHRGELLGIPPTGKQVTLAVMEVYRLTDGKIAEQWVTMDALGLLQQLGAGPAPAPGSEPAQAPISHRVHNGNPR